MPNATAGARRQAATIATSEATSRLAPSTTAGVTVVTKSIVRGV